MDEHRRLLTEDSGYVEARAAIETRARHRELELADVARVGVTRIPVVVHVVWHDAAENLSIEQIRSQIEVLNADFRRTNPDSASVPAVWQPIRGDARIEFELATVDPHGNATTGVTRRQTSAASFPQAGNPIKSAASGGADPWPADRYLNIWTAPRLTSPQGDLLGYAQFPGGPAATDGVVILHSAFGTTGTATAPFHRGRTATHEVGHWLNLFHIWGDDGTGCGGTDEVTDTPNAAGPNFGSPAFPHMTCSNGPDGDMFMNYMDYTDDAAMFMFTEGQVRRMQATLDGPRVSVGNPVQLVLGNFGYEAGGWRVEKHPRHVVDLTGDGRADILGFGETAVWVSRNTGNGAFDAPQSVLASFAYQAGGWRVEKHPRVLADTTGDGRPDIVGFGDGGVWVAANNGNGTFAQPQLLVANFGYVAGGWRVEKHPRFLVDVTGDGRADIVGCGDGGVWVSTNNGNGTFGQPKLTVANFGYVAGGWRVEKHPRLLADTTGDGLADIIGFGDGGVWMSRNAGSGTFASPQLVLSSFGYELGGWRVEKHPRHVVDLTGDGRGDILGFGDAGVWIARNAGDGTF